MIKYASATNVGLKRKVNEDSILAGGNLFAVADGMGGHNAGDVASQMTVKSLKHYLFPQEEKKIPQAIENCFATVNKLVRRRAQQVSDQKGMGTTLTLMHLNKNNAYFGHIGDSRAYICRNAKLKQLTKDHSLVADLVKKGEITKEEAKSHPMRNVITKALGSQPHVKADFFEEHLKVGDMVLLCSDGLTAVVDDKKITEILNRQLSLRKICDTLVLAANTAGGPDNISVVLIKVIDENAKLKKRITVTASIISVIIISLLLVYYAFNYVIENSFYIGFYKGRVAIFQGLPYDFLNRKLYKPKKVSAIKKEALNPLWESRVEEKVTFKNRSQAEQSLKNIAKEGLK